MKEDCLPHACQKVQQGSTESSISENSEQVWYDHSVTVT